MKSEINNQQSKGCNDHPLKILVIDDQPDNHTTLRAVLTEAFPDSQVLGALSGSQGIELALAEDPDMILLDIVMPGTDGFEVCRQLKANERVRHIPVLVQTAVRTDQSSRIKALEHGAEAFLSKPIDEAELIAQVRAMVKIKAAANRHRHDMDRLADMVAERTEDLSKELAGHARAEEGLRQANEQLRQIQTASLDLLEDLRHEIEVRKLAEERLRESQYFLVKAQTLTKIGYFKYDPKTGVVEGSDELFRVFGLSRAQFQFADFVNAMHPDDCEFVTGTICSSVNDGTSYDIKYRLLAQEGTCKYVHAIGEPVLGADGSTHLMVGTVQDITRQMQYEQTLRDSESRYRALFEGINNGVAVYEVKDNGRNFVFKDFNRAGERIDHDPREKLIGKSILDVRPGVERFGLIEVFRRVWQTGEPAHHPIALYQDNRLTGWYENYVYKLPSGEIVAVFEDITDRVRAQEAQEAHAAFLETLLRAIPNPIFFKDREGRYLGCNPAFEAMMGVTKEKIIGKTVHEAWPAQLSDIYRDRDLELLEQPGEQQYEFQVHTADGQVRDVAFYKSTFHDAHGQVAGIVGSMLDITEIKQAQARLRVLASELTVTEERERRRLAEVLHDNIAQTLAFAKMKLQCLGEDVQDRALAAELAETCEALGTALGDIRSLTLELSSPVLKDLGLGQAVAAWLKDPIERKHGLRTEFVDDGRCKPLDEDLKVLVFRSVRELLYNVVKHAHATWTGVYMEVVGDRLKVRVEDDGKGLDSTVVGDPNAPQGFGLFSIRERLAALGGTIRLEGREQSGLRATIEVPLKAQM